MRTRRPTTALVVLSLLAGGLLTASGDAAPLATRMTIPIAGTVDGLPESVSLSGSISIASTLIVDPLLDAPRVLLSFKLVNVSGTGLVTGARYVAAGEDTDLRVLAISDKLEIMFPLYRDTPTGPLSARSAMASIVVKYDLVTGAPTAATASFSAPKLAG
jgi:hypothetical protein